MYCQYSAETLPYSYAQDPFGKFTPRWCVSPQSAITTRHHARGRPTRPAQTPCRARGSRKRRRGQPDTVTVDRQGDREREQHAAAAAPIAGGSRRRPLHDRSEMTQAGERDRWLERRPERRPETRDDQSRESKNRAQISAEQSGSSWRSNWRGLADNERRG